MNYNKFISPASALKVSFSKKLLCLGDDNLPFNLQDFLPKNSTYINVPDVSARLTFDKVVSLDQDQQSLEVDFTIELSWNDPR